MRIVDALVEVLKDSESLTYKEAYLKIVERNLYQFGAKDPEAAVNAKLRCHCEGLDFPGASPVKYFKIVGKKGTRNLYALVKEGQEDLIPDGCAECFPFELIDEFKQEYLTDNS